MKKLLRILFILVLLGLWFLSIIKNPQWTISQKVLPLVGLEKLLPNGQAGLTWQNVGLANPASVFCVQNSGTLEIVTDLSGWQSGICHLLDGTTCDEWAYFRGECPSTGMSETTGTTETTWVTETSWWLMNQVSQEINNEQTSPSTGTSTITTTNTTTPVISTNKMIFGNYSMESLNNICKWYDSEWIPNSNRAKAAKFINAKLQDVRDNGEYLVNQYINDANTKLDDKSLSNSDKCMYSRLIDALQSQQWYLRSYKTENGVTTIGIDFIAYQDDISKIAYNWPPRLEVMINTSTKVRYYTLSSNPQLQTLNVDNNWYVWSSENKYINNFDNRLNEFCNNEHIYNGERDTDRKGNDLGIIDWNNFRGEQHNVYCVKNMLDKAIGQPESADKISFGFNADWELQKIDLNRWNLALAG
jgi:putative hemolysin